MLRKGAHKKINNCGDSDVIQVKNKKMKTEEGKTIHDTEKPVELMEYLIKNSSNDNEVIFDPFMGSNTTGKMALLNNRRFIGVEKVEYLENMNSSAKLSIPEIEEKIKEYKAKTKELI